MTQEEKELLLKALCGYFPYGLKVSEYFEESKIWSNPRDFEDVGPYYILKNPEKIKPYLRPMLSMTEEEKNEWVRLRTDVDKYIVGYEVVVDFYNKNHLDYRGLIMDDLAFEATEDMYN